MLDMYTRLGCHYEFRMNILNCYIEIEIIMGKFCEKNLCTAITALTLSVRVMNITLMQKIGFRLAAE